MATICEKKDGRKKKVNPNRHLHLEDYVSGPEKMDLTVCSTGGKRSVVETVLDRFSDLQLRLGRSRTPERRLRFQEEPKKQPRSSRSRFSVTQYIEYLVGRNGGTQNDSSDPIFTLIWEAVRVLEQFYQAIFLHLMARVKKIYLVNHLYRVSL